MTYKEVSDMIEGIGLPFAYYEFPQTIEGPPFICFLYPDADDFLADNTNYAKIRPLSIELYTDNKDFALEATAERTLAEHGLVFAREETFIDSERMHMVTYTTDIIITEEDLNGE